MSLRRAAALVALLQRVVSQELLDQVDVRQDHTSAAVALQAQAGQGGALVQLVLLQHVQVGLPFVTDDLAA